MAGGKPNKTKDEFPPLLEAGFHTKTLEDLKVLVVDGFPKSQRRQTLWNNFLHLLALIKQAGLSCDIWVDGSFLTQKIDPDDVDFVVEVPISALTAPSIEQQEILNQLSLMAYCKTFRMHSFVIYSAPIGHKAFGKCQAARSYWEGAFGKSYIKKEPKGIAVVEVRP